MEGVLNLMMEKRKYKKKKCDSKKFWEKVRTKFEGIITI